MEIILGPVAVAENNCIGRNNDLPWGRKLKGDLKHFKELTSGHTVIMGRRTFESIGRPLPERQNIILSNEKLDFAGCQVAYSLPEALKIARDSGAKKAFLIGGRSVFQEGLNLADKMYLTRVHESFEGDTFFPNIPEDKWRKISEDYRPKNEDNAYDTTFEVYGRIN